MDDKKEKPKWLRLKYNNYNIVTPNAVDFVIGRREAILNIK